MLGDNAEKSKNPLKKAMRRRNAKTVTFTSPTFFEPSDNEYSTEEEEEEDTEHVEEEESRAESQDTQYDIQDEDMVVEPLRPKQHKEKVSRVEEPEEEEIPIEPSSPEKPRPSDESFERPGTSCAFYSELLTDYWLQLDREMVHYAIRILSSTTTQRKLKRYQSLQAFFATIALPTDLRASHKRYLPALLRHV